MGFRKTVGFFIILFVLLFSGKALDASIYVIYAKYAFFAFLVFVSGNSAEHLIEKIVDVFKK